MTAAWTRPPSQHPWVLGHRGARNLAPENTIPAFECALELGADGVELDVRSCRCGELVVFHDPKLTRMTGGNDTRRVSELSFSELNALKLAHGPTIPRLEEVLEWARGRDARVNVELKHDVANASAFVERVCCLLRDTSPDRVLVSCFHPWIVRKLARALPNHVVGWLVHAGQPWARQLHGWRWLGARAAHPQSELVSPKLARRLKSQGARLNVWTVNDPARARELATLGADTLISDEPGLIVEALKP